jgi:hypothetical protein
MNDLGPIIGDFGPIGPTSCNGDTHPENRLKYPFFLLCCSSSTSRPMMHAWTSVKSICTRHRHRARVWPPPKPALKWSQTAC